VAEARQKAKAELVSKIEQGMPSLRSLAVAEFEAVINQVIKDLGFLDRIRTD
jgi:hypothetical protein